jgi:light-regulated signal transduction histidine kinase (bacteriophytochrome)
VAQCNIRDISERKHADDEVRRLTAELELRVAERTAQLEVLNQELESFSYSVSHDLRAPLRRITGFANVLREDFADRQSAESLHVIEKICASVENMSALTDALINLAYFSHIALQRSNVDLSAMAHLVAADLQLSQPDRNVSFVIAEGLTCRGDAALLRIVLDNLLGNAWKFTARCSAALIEFGVTPAANGSDEFFVRDNGAGFNMAYAERLFGTFQRLHHQREFPGIGVGLATVQRIVRRHGGRIWAQSSVGQGATFYFSIGDVTSEPAITSSANTAALRHLDMPLV